MRSARCGGKGSSGGPPLTSRFSPVPRRIAIACSAVAAAWAVRTTAARRSPAQSPGATPGTLRSPRTADSAVGHGRPRAKSSATRRASAIAAHHRSAPGCPSGGTRKALHPPSTSGGEGDDRPERQLLQVVGGHSPSRSSSPSIRSPRPGPGSTRCAVRRAVEYRESPGRRALLCEVHTAGARSPAASRAIIDSSSVGMTRTWTRPPSAEISAVPPRCAGRRARSRGTPRPSQMPARTSGHARRCRRRTRGRPGPPAPRPGRRSPS